jgi:hypothetical protein
MGAGKRMFLDMRQRVFREESGFVDIWGEVIRNVPQLIHRVIHKTRFWRPPDLYARYGGGFIEQLSDFSTIVAGYPH